MRLAFISDIHANLPALEATLSAIDAQQPAAIFCLGDLVNQNVWNNEVVELIQRRRIRTVKGNHDNGIALGKTFFRFSYTFPEAKQWGKEAIAYTLRTIKPENAAFLGSLPLSLTLTVRHKGERPFTLLLVHGSPAGMDDTLFRHMHREHYRHSLDIARTDILICGQAHTPYHYVFPSEDNDPVTYRHLLCPGSVGRPHDGDWRPSHLLLDLYTDKDLRTDPEAVRPSFYRTPYDLDKAVKAIRHSELAVYYGGCLITGQ